MPEWIKDDATEELTALYARLVQSSRESIARYEAAHRPLEREVYPIEVLQRPDRERIAAAEDGKPIRIHWFQLPLSQRDVYPDHLFLLYPDGRYEPAGGEPITPAARSTT
jgi:hypothetical protein